MKCPKYVKMNEVTLRWDRNSYWRDAGKWGVGAVEREGKFYSVSDMKNLNDVELIEISLEEYSKDNGHYAHHKFKIISSGDIQ